MDPATVSRGEVSYYDRYRLRYAAIDARIIDIPVSSVMEEVRTASVLNEMVGASTDRTAYRNTIYTVYI